MKLSKKESVAWGGNVPKVGELWHVDATTNHGKECSYVYKIIAETKHNKRVLWLAACMSPKDEKRFLINTGFNLCLWFSCNGAIDAIGLDECWLGFRLKKAGK